MKRDIYEIHIAYVNDNGFHASDPNVNGHQYPIVVDSINNNNDPELALRKARGYLGEAEKYLANQSDHQIDYAYIIRVSDGVQIEKRLFGRLADLPDPEPEIPEENGSAEGGEG